MKKINLDAQLKSVKQKLWAPCNDIVMKYFNVNFLILEVLFLPPSIAPIVGLV